MKRFSFASLRVRLIILVLIAIIPALGLTLYSGIERRGHERQDTFDNALRLAEGISETHDRLIQNVRQILFTLSKIPYVQQQDKAACSGIFAEIKKQSEGFVSLSAAKPNGDLFASSTPINSPINFSDRPWFQRVLKTRDFVIGEYLIGRIINKPLIALAHPVFDGTGYLKAILFSGIDLEWLNKTIVSSRLQEGTSVSVIDSNGTVLFRYPEPEKFVGKSMREAAIVKTMLAKRKGVEESEDIDGIRRLFGFTELGKGVESVHVAVGILKQIALAKSDRNMKHNLVYLGFVAILALAAAWFMGGFLFIRPVSWLLETTKRIEEGDLTAWAGPSYGNGEIGKLAYALDQMAESLKQRETERSQAVESLKESEERFRALFEQASIGIAEIDTKTGRFIRINQKYCDIAGYSIEEMMAMTFMQITSPEDLQTDLDSVRKIGEGEIRIYAREKRYIRKEGEIVWVNLTVSPIWEKNDQFTRHIAVVEDISERKRAEKKWGKLQKQLLQSQKMEAIGTLAGGIAHDFNNILSAIIGYTELALEKSKGTLVEEDLREVLIASGRATDLVRQILAFSRQDKQEAKPIQVKPIANEVLKLLRPSLPTTIEIRTNIQSDALVMADPTQIHQTLMNLCTNASHAMQEEGGSLEISLTDISLDSGFTSRHSDIKPGAFIKLMVRDSGHGIAPDLLDKIFDPFFTTKEKEKGTGLGLSVVHGIVKTLGGTITVYSEPEKGAEFNVYLPVLEREIKKGAQEFEVLLPTGSERILFVDDEQAIRDISKKLFESLGYHVEVRSNAIEALEFFKANPERFDLIISDMTMPGMTGDRLAEELMTVRPEIPVIICTGFSTRMDKEKAHGMGVRAYALKPIIKRDIANIIRKVLDEAKS